MKALMKLYMFLLHVLNLGERRCGWCQRFLGWRYGLRGMTSHGICVACNAKWNADLEADCLKQAIRLKREQKRKNRRYQTRRSTLRRRTGGWSGAVALRGRVS